MKARDPRERPQPGDKFLYRGWTILVTQRVGGDVFLSATHQDGRVKRETPQSVADFRKWACDATPLTGSSERAEMGCVATPNVSAPCEVDGIPIVGHAHVFDGKIRCAAHCLAVHKKAKKASNAA